MTWKRLYEKLNCENENVVNYILNYIGPFNNNKDENVQRFELSEIRGELLEREREKERDRKKEREREKRGREREKEKEKKRKRKREKEKEKKRKRKRERKR